MQTRKTLGQPLSKLTLTWGKLDSFSGIIAPSKSIKHVPTPIWIWEKYGKRLVKIEGTYQEEVEEEVSQETMAAPIDDTMAQKILKALDEHGDTLKKMGSRLTKLEEAKLKKAAHVKIHNFEEMEDWDERDKVDYEKNKQFKKLTTETITIREKMEKMQLSFRKA